MKKLLLVILGIFFYIGARAEAYEFRTVGFASRFYNDRMQYWSHVEVEPNYTKLIINYYDNTITLYSRKIKIYKIIARWAFDDANGNINKVYKFVDQDGARGTIKLLMRANGTHGFIFSDKRYTQAQMDAMNDQINDLRKQRDDANKRVDECLLIIRDLQGANETLSNELKKSNDNEIPEVPDSPIGFKQGSYEINETSLPMIKDLAEFMKSNNKTYVISGYASVEGTKEFNQKLSEQRADAIKDQLIKFGVSPDRLETRAFGATDEFGTKPFNRIVIATVK